MGRKVFTLFISHAGHLGWVEVYLYTFLGPFGTRRGWGSAPRLGRLYPRERIRYSLYSGLCGPQGRSGRAEHFVPTGIRSRPVQPGSSVTIPTELPGPHKIHVRSVMLFEVYISEAISQESRRSRVSKVLFVLFKQETLFSMFVRKCKLSLFGTK